ncbi:MAG: hypothetical protein EPO61_01890 [Nitrospirae bacterium]|nr:MAG: hypothetical protein EPO61_01890 [Nitrospirota bacterium]
MSDKIADYKALLDLYMRAVQTMAGKQPSVEETWMVEAEHLAQKLFMHLASLLYLRSGTRIDEFTGQRIHFFDFASSAVLARTAYETYLTFYFIFAVPKAAQERCFRCQVWKLGGLLDRQRFPPISQEGKQRLEQETIQIQELRSRIEQSPAFIGLPVKRQKDVLKGRWKLGKTWKEIAMVTGSSKRYFVGLYAYLSSYTHSGYLSALQVGQAEGKDVQYKLGELHVGVGLSLMSHFLDAYSSLFPPVKHLIDADSASKKLLEKWLITGQDMDRLYDSPSTIR